MGMYIGDVWIPFVGSANIDDGSRVVKPIKHVDSSTPIHYAEFLNPEMKFNIKGTVIRNSASPKTAYNYAEDLMSLLDGKVFDNYINDFQGRSGWVSIKSVKVPENADFPLSRDYTLDGNFLPLGIYKPLIKTEVSVEENDFGIVWDDAERYFYTALPIGSIYSSDVASCTGIDGAQDYVLNPYYADVEYDISGNQTGVGECKVYDTVIGDDTTESNWIRVYNKNHTFTGDCVIENNFIRIKIFDDGAAPLMYGYSGSAWVQLADIRMKYIIYSYSSDLFLYDIIELNDSKVHARIWRLHDGDTRVMAEIILEMGEPYAQLNGINSNTYLYHDVTGLYDYCFYSNGFVDGVYSANASYGSSEADSIHLLFNDGAAYMFFVTAMKSYLKTTKGSTGITTVSKNTYSSCKNNRAGIIYSGSTPMLIEAESANFTSGGSVSSYTGTDASPGTGNTGINLLAQNSYIEAYDDDFPFEDGLYSFLFVLRAKDSNQVADDLSLKIYDDTVLSSCVVDTTITLTSSFQTYVYEVVMDGAYHVGGGIKLEKLTATSNTITIDYVNLIPYAKSIYTRNVKYAKNVMYNTFINKTLTKVLYGRNQ